MNEQLNRECRRWLENEQAGREEDADVAFARVFPAAGTGGLSPGFTVRTMEAVAAAVASDRRRARRTRRIVVPLAVLGGAGLVYASAGVLTAAFTVVVVRTLDLLVGAIVGLATTPGSGGGDIWTLMSSLGRAAAALLSNPAVTTTILALQGIAAVALVALQRLLRSDRESFR